MSKRIFMWKNYPMGLYKAFELFGIETYPASGEYEKKDEKRLCWIKEHKKDIDYIFSFDFDVNLAKTCSEAKILYISWSVDSPHLSLYNDVAKYETNRMFIFDRQEFCTLKSLGLENIYYLPLATDVESLHQNSLLDHEKRWYYTQDVAFMGNLYDRSPHNMYDSINYMPDYLQGYIDALFAAQYDLWGMDIFKSQVVTNICDELKKYIKLDMKNKYADSFYQVFIDQLLSMKLAQLERKTMCDSLSKRYDFTLYSGSDTSYNPQIRNRGYINYLKDMPYMFRNTKININLNLHCISSGIPLRVLDILACQGFCLTNYQEEIAEYFDVGKELVIYEDFDDMCDKIDYYITHEDERKKIASKGYEKVREVFSYENAVKAMIECI